MKICEGLELNPSEFRQQVRNIRHLRPLVEKTDEKSVITALHKAWLENLNNALQYASLAIGYLRDVEDYDGQEWKLIDKFTRGMNQLEKQLKSFEKQTHKWRTGVNLYFERPIDVPRLKSDLKINLKSLEDLQKGLDKAVKDAEKLKGGTVETYDVKKTQTSLGVLGKAMKMAISGL